MEECIGIKSMTYSPIKGTEKTAGLLNTLRLIKGFQWLKPPPQLFTSMLISSKLIMCICHGTNLENNSEWNSWVLSGQNIYIHFSVFPENSGDKAEMWFFNSFTVLSNPKYWLGLWKKKEKKEKLPRNTKIHSAPARRKVG